MFCSSTLFIKMMVNKVSVKYTDRHTYSGSGHLPQWGRSCSIKSSNTTLSVILEILGQEQCRPARMLGESDTLDRGGIWQFVLVTPLRETTQCA
jgi:hypothetical protein